MRFTRLSAIIGLILLSAALAYQLVSKPATAQGITYALSRKAATAATATPAAATLPGVPQNLGAAADNGPNSLSPFTLLIFERIRDRMTLGGLCPVL